MQSPATVPHKPASVGAFLASAARRTRWLAAARGAAIALVLSAVAAGLRWPRFDGPSSYIVAGAVLATLGALVGALVTIARHQRVEYLVEARAPRCRNLLITAAEIRDNASTSRIVRDAIDDRASRLVRELDLASLFPARDALLWLVVGGALWAVAVTRLLAPELVPRGLRGAAVAGGVGIDRIDVVVTPPAYADGTPATFRDPSRIEALAGSAVRIRVAARADRVVFESLRSRDTVASSNGGFTATLTADADGYVAIEPRSGSSAGVRRLIGVSVIPDDPPRVRVTAPGKDLFLRDARKTLDVAIDAGDDIGLRSLALRYTKVSGSGERYTFTDGELPIAITRTNSRTWKGTATWNLATLGLEPGDMVVYRAVATDGRPGAPPSESDSFIAEILAPGGQAAPGFEMDPEQERYAVSQQMVILKTERLAARKPQMSADEYATASAELAAEQRKVRAEFVFMMGGELADAPDIANMTEINEEQEAAGEADILAGRNANQGRVALLRAIRAMSRAATSLTVADLPTALPHERAALTQLEQAFSHSRIILRALSQRERLDLSRRLTGVLSDASRDVRAAAEAQPEPRVLELRRALADIASLASSPSLAAADAARAAAIAERVLRVDPSSKNLQRVSSNLNDAAQLVAANRADDARRSLDAAASSIATALQSDLLDAPRNAHAADLDKLGGALTDALRRARGAR